MYRVKSYVCSALATSVRQTFLHTGHETVISHWPSTWLPNNSSFLTTAWGHCGSKDGSKEAVVSVLNYFICPVPSSLLADLFKFSRGTKWSTLCGSIPSCPLARTWWAKPSTLLSMFSLLLWFLAEMSFISSQKLVQGQCQLWAFSLLLATLDVWQEVGQRVPWQQWNVKSNFWENFVILKAMGLFQMELTPT